MTTAIDDDEEFRKEVRGWLSENVPRGPLPPIFTVEGIDAHRAWERALNDAGYAAMHWPAEYGGGGASLLTQAVFQEEYQLASAPERLNRLGLGLIGPTLIEFGTEQQKQRLLPRILDCDELWCQGFSEPEAGSDLAAIRARARREGDELVIDGQKIWTSLSIFADWMFALVRTGELGEGHRGLTFVLIPMSSPGIEVRPIRQLHGDPGFAEVFFTDVRVPVANVVGEIGDGWTVAMATLGYERGTGLGDHVRFTRKVWDLVQLAHRTDQADDTLVRDQVAARYVDSQVFKHFMKNVISRLENGEQLGHEASLVKLFWSEMDARIFETALNILGPDAELDPTPHLDASARFHRNYWHARASKIFAGTSEIQRNIISERLLGLPKERRWT
ncbi:MAG: acyl-CoA dehydrogenase family protein [Rhodoglobus sp.]